MLFPEQAQTGVFKRFYGRGLTCEYKQFILESYHVNLGYSVPSLFLWPWTHFWVQKDFNYI